MTMEIALTQGQVALIDDEDCELVSGYKWYAQWDPKMRSFYAKANTMNADGKRTALLMHRLIMNARKGDLVDHIHHLTLDNRKSELRICTRNQNNQNARKRVDSTSGVKGVSFKSREQKWNARISANGKYIHLGYFDTLEQAAMARAAAVILYHGEFGRIACP